MQRIVSVSFAGSDAADNDRYADDLNNALLRDYPEIIVRRSRNQPHTQDFGSTLIIILGTTAVNSLAQGIAAWLKRNAGARITIKNVNGELIAEHLESKDVSRLLEALSHASNDRPSNRKLT